MAGPGDLAAHPHVYYIRLTVQHILDVNIKDETFTLELDVYVRWEDARLRPAHDGHVINVCIVDYTTLPKR